MNTLSLVTACAVSLVLAGASLPAQNLLSYRPDGGAGVPPRMFEFPCASPAWVPALGGPGIVRPPYPGRARPLLAHPNGAVAIDAFAGVVFTTNGVATIQRTEYPRIGSAAGVAIPDLPIPAAVGNVTGMAVDPMLHRIFLSNGPMIFEVDPLAGMAIVGMFPTAPLTISGLDYDPAQPGVVFAVSIAGEVATYNRGGGLLAVAPPTYAPPGGMATGVALDKSSAAGGHFYVVHANGDVYDHTTGALHTVGAADVVGNTYLASAVLLPSVGACAGAAPAVTTTDLVLDGIGGVGLEVHGLPAGTPFVAFGVNVFPPGTTPTPAFGLPIGCGDSLWLMPGLGSGIVPLLSLPAGASATQFLALPPGFGGWTIVSQPLVPCPFCAAGFVLPDAMHLQLSRG